MYHELEDGGKLSIQVHTWAFLILKSASLRLGPPSSLSSPCFISASAYEVRLCVCGKGCKREHYLHVRQWHKHTHTHTHTHSMPRPVAGSSIKPPKWIPYYHVTTICARQWQCSAKHEVARRALADDWRRWPPKISMFCTVFQLPHSLCMESLCAKEPPSVQGWLYTPLSCILFSTEESIIYPLCYLVAVA